jgi:hypothetical protein
VSSTHFPSAHATPSHLLLIDDDLPLAKLIAELEDRQALELGLRHGLGTVTLALSEAQYRKLLR